ncbi:MAG: carboxylating nicotinate-nucleotide diphosphorylase [Rhodanobacteraceae bacterium]
MTRHHPGIPDQQTVLADVRRALDEDIGPGDASADLVGESEMASARVVCREPATLAGAPWFEACLRALDPDLEIRWHFRDGDTVEADTILCEIKGKARALLSAERSALNFLQTLSATASTTARYSAVVSGSRTRILDTRKTLPGLRAAQKYAVRCGGGSNHRMGLFDAILIKENHISAAGGIAPVVRAARKKHPGLLLEIEVESLDELEQALAAGVDRVMLDEFNDSELGEALALIDGRAQVEISGGVDLARLRELADLGVDYISIGALTKNIQAIDLSMRMD